MDKKGKKMNNNEIFREIVEGGTKRSKGWNTAHEGDSEATQPPPKKRHISFDRIADESFKCKGSLCSWNGLRVVYRGYPEELKIRSLPEPLDSLAPLTINLMCQLCSKSGLTRICNWLDHVSGKRHRQLSAGWPTCLLMNPVSPQDQMVTVAGQLCSCVVPDTLSSEYLLSVLKPTIPTSKKGAIKFEIVPYELFYCIKIHGIGRGTSFSKCFKDIITFIENTESLQYLTFLSYSRNEGLAFCTIKKRKNSEIKPSVLYVDGREVEVEVTSNNLQELEGGETWRQGEMTPLCRQLLCQGSSHIMNVIDALLEEALHVYKGFDFTASIIARHLRQSLPRPFFIVDAVNFFGSRVTGLAMSQSDLDIVLQMAFWNKKCAVRIQDLVSFIRKGNNFFIKSVISGARIPIIKLVHKETGLPCDISLNNMNGVHNSQLLRVYLNLDERVRWLVTAVKQWARLSLLLSSHQINSYAWALLVLFYLMQPSVALVPPARLLTKLHSSNFMFPRLYPLNCDHSFCLDERAVTKAHSPSKCFLGHVQLLQGFFKFYLKEDGHDAIDIFTGTRISRLELFSRPPPPEGVPSNLLNTHKPSSAVNHTFIVIDPIQHYVNTAPAARPDVLAAFRQQALLALNSISYL